MEANPDGCSSDLLSCAGATLIVLHVINSLQVGLQQPVEWGFRFFSSLQSPSLPGNSFYIHHLFNLNKQLVGTTGSKGARTGLKELNFVSPTPDEVKEFVSSFRKNAQGSLSVETQHNKLNRNVLSQSGVEPSTLGAEDDTRLRNIVSAVKGILAVAEETELPRMFLVSPLLYNHEQFTSVLRQFDQRKCAFHWVATPSRTSGSTGGSIDGFAWEEEAQIIKFFEESAQWAPFSFSNDRF